jgi:hypothetical protein
MRRCLSVMRNFTCLAPAEPVADRAYLYPAAQSDDWISSGKDCWDSRHYIPLAWLFLFHADDIRLHEVSLKEFGLGTFQNLGLTASREAALQLFNARRPHLEHLLGDSFSPAWFSRLTTALEGAVEPFLILEPSELLEDDDLEWLTHILQFIDAGSSEKEFWEACRPWAPSLKAIRENPELHVIGYTYPWDDDREGVFYHRVVSPDGGAL